ncbi:MAG: hypothetical protein AB7F22_33735 [Reyranella sp.]|uniref:hypothetical protein n=1 Tax=Reyranella sp. TaxID=1929291 RepID=UPI003D0FAD6D
MRYRIEERPLSHDGLPEHRADLASIVAAVLLQPVQQQSSAGLAAACIRAVQHWRLQCSRHRFPLPVAVVERASLNQISIRRNDLKVL